MKEVKNAIIESTIKEGYDAGLHDNRTDWNSGYQEGLRVGIEKMYKALDLASEWTESCEGTDCGLKDHVLYVMKDKDSKEYDEEVLKYIGFQGYQNGTPGRQP